MAINKKQIFEFDLHSTVVDTDQFILQTQAGVTKKTTKSALLNDVNTSLIGLQTQITSNDVDILDLQTKCDTISGDLNSLEFLDLKDTPSTYSGSDSYVLTVSGNSIVFAPPAEPTVTNIRGQEPCVINQQTYFISYGQTISGGQPVISLEVPTSGSTIFVQGIYDVVDTGFNVVLSEAPSSNGYFINWVTSYGSAVDAANGNHETRLDNLETSTIGITGGTSQLNTYYVNVTGDTMTGDLVINADLTANGLKYLDVATGSTQCTFVGDTGNTTNTGQRNTSIGDTALSLNSSGQLGTAIGTGALLSNTTASSNTAIGSFSMLNTTIGGGNTTVGADSLRTNVSGVNNVAIGYRAGYNSVGFGNIFIGKDAGFNETTNQKLYIANNGTPTPLIYGDFDVPFLRVHGGFNARNVSDVQNVLIQGIVGQTADFFQGQDGFGNKKFGFDVRGAFKQFDLVSLDFSRFNTLVGSDAGGAGQPVSQYSVYIGYQAGLNETGDNLLYIANSSTPTPLIYGEFDNDLVRINGDLESNAFKYLDATTGGIDNFLIGEEVSSNVTGSYNTCLGGFTLSFLTSGFNNVAIGRGSLYAVTTGMNNVGLGRNAGIAISSGQNNMCIGQNAGATLETGSFNTFVGDSCGIFSTSSSNVGIGQGSCKYLTNSGNVGVGLNTLLNMTNATGNVAIGFGALTAAVESTGDNNIGIGRDSGYSLSTGANNVFIGFQSGYENTTAVEGTFVGYRSGWKTTTGVRNTFLGVNAGYSNLVGTLNTFVGYNCGLNNIASNNAFFGSDAGKANTSGTLNTFIGRQSGFANQTGNSNLFVGFQSGITNVSGLRNCFLGTVAGKTSTGSDNLMVGNAAGTLLSSGNYNVLLGSDSGKSLVTASNNIMIGFQSGGNSTGVSNVFIGFQSGQNEMGSNLLIVGNSSTSELIRGDFANETLKINGSLEVTQSLTTSALQSISGASDTLDATDYVTLCDCTSNNIVVNLPTAVGNKGLRYIIKKTDSTGNTATIDANGSETIDGSLTIVLSTQYDFREVISDGTNWFIIGKL